MRIFGKGAVNPAPGPPADIEELITRAALQVIESLQPYSAALYYQSTTNKPADYTNALRILEVCMHDPDVRKWALNLRGAVAFAQKHYDEAIDDYNWANEQYPDFPLSRYNLAQALNTRGLQGTVKEKAYVDFKDALRFSLEGVAIDGDSRSKAIGYVIAGNAARHLGDNREEPNFYQNALEYYRMAAIANPTDFFAQYQQGTLLMDKLKKYDEAIQKLRLASEIDASAPETYRQWACALLLRDHQQSCDKRESNALVASLSQRAQEAETKKLKNEMSARGETGSANLKGGGPDAAQGEVQQPIDLASTSK
jgi:tetratricopeptide (TPR) repeat protein